MADTAIAITAGSGTNVDARTEATNGNYRQVIVIGDPSTNAGVAPVDVTKGLAVDLTATGSNTNAIKVDGSAVTQPISAASLPLPSGAATAAKQPALGTAGTASADVISVQGIASMTALKVDGSAVTQPAKIVPATTGGLTTYHLVSAGSTNATVVKASAGQLYGWYIYNSNAAARKVAFHNASSAPTAGASIFFTLMIPPTSGANVFSETGIAFSTGIAITTVTGLADSDSAAVAANDLIINLFYN